MSDIEGYKQYLLSTGADPKEVDGYVNYLSQTQGPTDDQIENEMHSKIGTLDRALVKNLSQSNDVTIKHLKSKLPNADIREHNGEIIIKDQGETKYRKLDPSGFQLGDLGHDILDVGYDIVDGIGTSAATVAGGVGGAVAGMGVASPVTALAGASLVGGASSAASEAFRQKMGQQLGLDQEVDGTDVIISGGIGAASPLLLGTGATTKQMAKGVVKGNAAKNTLLKALGKTGKELSEEAIEKSVERSNRGLIQHGWAGTKGAAKRVGSFTSGKSVEQIDDYAKNIDYITPFENNEQALELEANRVAKKFGQGFDDRFSEVGGQLGDAIDATGKKVGLGESKQAFLSKIEQLEKLRAEDPSPILEAQINKLKKSYTDLFGVKNASETPVMDYATMTMRNAPTEMADNVSGRAAFNKQQQLKRMSRFDQLSEGVQTADGTPVDSSMVRGAARQGYHSINDGLDKATDGVSRELKDRYANMKGIEQNLEPFFENTKKTLQTARGYTDKQQYIQARTNLQRAIDQNVDGASDMKKFMAASQWTKQALLGKNTPAVGVGIATGAYAGANSGAGQGTAMPAGMVGGFLAGKALGPAAVKKAIKATIKAERAAGNISKAAAKSGIKAGKRHVVGKSVYHWMDEDKE